MTSIVNYLDEINKAIYMKDYFYHLTYVFNERNVKIDFCSYTIFAG